MAYQDPKEHAGRSYHGMKVGGTHRWSYPDGEWKEKKLEPNRWHVEFTSLKRRKRRAPRGSGAELGSGYHWLVVAHQWVTKLDANTYATQMEGEKYLIAFKKPDWGGWNTELRGRKGARQKTIQALEDALERVRNGPDDVENPSASEELLRLAALAAEQERIALETEKLAKRVTRGRPVRKRKASRPESVPEEEMQEA